tara:strand:- start:43 stop:438 length:396 start_codon:yes stop_codon:yes gene_type:complete
MTYVSTDGGRLEAGYKGRNAGDCAARSVAIALQIPYKQAYLELARASKEFGFKRSARDGIHKPVFEHFLKKHGWSWRSAPKFDGRKARCSDLLHGRVIASQAGHYVAVVDGVPHDIWDCSNRMVYGYYAKD